MIRPVLYILALLAELTLSLACAQDSVALHGQQPVIYGEINGMKVMVQGDAVAFMASRHYAMKLDKEACARDLHCTLQKNRTEAVVLNPENIWIFDTPPKQLPDNVIVAEPLYPVSTEADRLFSTALKPTPTYILLEFPQPTATLHTGNEVVDKTPGILLVSSPVMTWLAETVTAVSHSRQAMDSEESLSSIIKPTPTQRVMLTTITEEEDELLRKLTSTSTIPMPTPTPTQVENRLWVDGSIRLEIETDIFTLKPSPSEVYASSSESECSYTFTKKQAPTSSGEAGSLSGETTSAASAEASATPAPTHSPNTDYAKPDQGMNTHNPKRANSALADFESEQPAKKKQKMNDEAFPEFEHLKDHKRFKDRKPLEVDPKKWQDFLRTKIKPLKDDKTQGAPGKDTYHGFERIVGFKCIEGTEECTKGTRCRNGWLGKGCQYAVVKECPPIAKYPEETVREFEQWEEKVKAWCSPLDDMNIDDEGIEEALRTRNPYERTLCEMYRLPCPECGFLMVPHEDDSKQPLIPPCYWGHEEITGLSCTACFPDKCVQYPLPECPFRKPPPRTLYDRYAQ